MKKTVALIMVLILFCFAVSACSADKNSSQAAATTKAELPTRFKTAEEIKNGLTNYEIKITFFSKDSLTQNETNIKELRCNQASLVQIDNSIYFMDYDTDTMYILDEETKTGFKSQSNESLNEYADIFSSYLANWQPYSSLLKSPKSDELIGRSCKRYDFEAAGTKYSYWIDDETQICLKFNSENGEKKYIMTVDKLEKGKVSKTGLLDMSEYEIVTIDVFES